MQKLKKKKGNSALVDEIWQDRNVLFDLNSKYFHILCKKFFLNKTLK